MRIALVLAAALLGLSTAATAQITIGIELPSVRIGVDVGVYPELVAVPGYPVYYAPQLDSNLFFYDGMYWVYSQDGWYASSWYNGPWDAVAPESVPLFVLRIPVRYYRRPPAYFRGWGPDAPPRWGEHWGHGWEQQHSGWDHWDHASAPAPAPLPSYQRAYSGSRYPAGDQQRALRDTNYHYQPRDAAVRPQYERPHATTAPAQHPATKEITSPAATPPAARRGSAPPAAEHAVTSHSETRPPPAAAATDTHRAQPERGAAPQPAPAMTPHARPTASPEAQRKPSEEARHALPAAPATRAPSSPSSAPPQARAPQAPPPHEAPPPHAREPAEKPHAAAPEHAQKAPPEHEQKKEPEREPK